jgi:catechol 2,3-dioxygenase-like lactoylglutathione lyase family enzyme
VHPLLRGTPPLRLRAQSAAFYARFAGFEVVHRRGAAGSRVIWLSDLRRPFAVVLVESVQCDARLDGIAHLGIGCASREEVDALCADAARSGCLERPPADAGPPVGYMAILRDPDGHNLELSHGQQVGVEIHRAAHTP